MAKGHYPYKSSIPNLWLPNYNSQHAITTSHLCIAEVNPLAIQKVYILACKGLTKVIFFPSCPYTSDIQWISFYRSIGGYPRNTPAALTSIRGRLRSEPKEAVKLRTSYVRLGSKWRHRPHRWLFRCVAAFMTYSAMFTIRIITSNN